MELYIVLLFAFGAVVFAEDAPCEFPVRIHSGVVCGVKKKASNGDDFVSFMGIPYAKAPVGLLRFADPEDPEPFNGAFDATKQGPACPQSIVEFLLKEKAMTSEDCLRINVHVPLSSLPVGSSQKTPLPVFTFVHGGSFTSGSGNPDMYGPEYLMTKGIVLVTINYRLSFIGFLSLNSKYVPGNAGLRDTIFALKWVQRNIRNFGGDPAEVTLGGQSAAGTMVHLVALSPAVRGLGLFKRVIALSGNALVNFYTPSPLLAKISSQLFLYALSISPLQSDKAIHRKLCEASIEELLQADHYVRNKTGVGINFCPVVESTHEGVTAIIPKDPEHLMNEGYGKEYTSLFGFTNNECHAYKPALEAVKITEVPTLLPLLVVARNLIFQSNILTVPILNTKIQNQYFNGSRANLKNILAYCTDSFYKYPTMRVVDRRLAVDSEPTYVFEYAYNALNSTFKTVLKTDYQGAAHAEDLTYFFRFNSFLDPIVNDELAQPDPDSQMRQLMTTFIANFVKNGHPSSTPGQWTPTDKDYRYMSIDDPQKYHEQPATPYMRDMKKFFDSLYRIGRVELFGS